MFNFILRFVLLSLHVVYSQYYYKYKDTTCEDSTITLNIHVLFSYLDCKLGQTTWINTQPGEGSKIGCNKSYYPSLGIQYCSDGSSVEHMFCKLVLYETSHQ